MYEAIQALLDSKEFSIIESFNMEERPARYAEIPTFLSNSPLGSLLRQRYATGLWSHQAKALEMLGRGDNVVISTGTASGKSLVFQTLALHKVVQDSSSRVVVFYPLRALVSDQLRSWKEAAQAIGLDETIVGQIDGSVPFHDRDTILQEARVVVMTPDVCHAWLMSRLAMPAVRNFVGALSTVIMDEAHTLEGVFGSNFAFLLRRLMAARNHLIGRGSQSQEPQLVAATATIANPGEHMRQLTGADFSVVDHEDDGAPRYERIVAHIACAEQSELQLANELQRRVLHHGREGGFITFVDSRKGVETLTIATQQDVDELAKNLAVVPYRSGYTAADRQRIERELQNGTRRGVVSTSALELGIDLPHLRVGFNVGVPATRKAYRQRLGRVGRSGPGAFIIIGPPNAFTRYGTSLEEYHRMSVEPSYLYLDNRFMQFAHGRCLAVERESLAAPSGLPTRVNWPERFGEIYDAAKPGGNRPPEFDAIAELGGDTPQRGYPLRNVGEFNYQIRRGRNADSFGDVNQSQALRECYPGGTYYHYAQAYEVASWFTRGFEPFIQVKPTNPRRRTSPRITTWINTGITSSDLIDGHFIRGENGFLAECQMQITERVEGYVDAQGNYLSYQDLQQHDSNMRPRSRNFRTSGVVFCIDEDWFKKQSVKGRVADRLREVFAHEYSLLPHDIGSAATNVSVRNADGIVHRGACIAVFDTTYGSLRFTENLYLQFAHILERLAVAAEAESDEDSTDFKALVELIRERFATFTASVFAGDKLFDDVPSGYQQVFTEGSRVCFREHGQIARDVEIIEPTLMEGRLMYRVKVEAGPGLAATRKWVPADRVEPSADADSWEFAWWNPATETYEDPPDEADDD